MNIFEALKKDHKTQRELASDLLKTADPGKREELFIRLNKLIKAHARSEERYFYIALMADDESQDQARHSISEHHEIDELSNKVEEADTHSDEWQDKFRKLHDLLIHHLDEEEDEIFPVADEVLSDKQIDDLAKRYDEMMADLK